MKKILWFFSGLILAPLVSTYFFLKFYFRKSEPVPKYFREPERNYFDELCEKCSARELKIHSLFQLEAIIGNPNGSTALFQADFTRIRESGNVDSMVRFLRSPALDCIDTGENANAEGAFSPN